MNPELPAADLTLPPRPERPDCCGGGCAVCVLDSWYDELERWERECAEILRRREQAAQQQQ
ncbi:MAG TPA: oxidoreductase-like domain-containing protein [Nevskiaceae bacterium]|nr:oxidoreductase-like domain-containing protein [Nevskiaceae bacterium]